jgi:hypothetical protein
MPCSILVLPVLSDSISANKNNKNCTVYFISIPMVKGKPAYSETMATIGKVSPIPASAEPTERLNFFCSWLFLAACTAALPSGNNTIKAMITPGKLTGAPMDLIQCYRPGASSSEGNTTARKQTTNSF